MLQRQIFYSERMNLCFDGSVMSGDVDVMWESICQISVSQLVFLCYHPQFIPQNYTTCGKGIVSVHCINACSNGMTSSVAGFLFQSFMKKII